MVTFINLGTNQICSGGSGGAFIAPPLTSQTTSQSTAQGCATNTFNTYFNTPGISTGTADTIASSYANAITGTSSTFIGSNSSAVFTVDEDEYVNHTEYYELARQRGVIFRIRTAEEKRLAEEAAEQARIVREQRELERQAAKRRAHELLLSYLTAEQRETVEKHKWFVVVGGKSKTKYRIRTDKGVAGNIEVLSWGRKVATLCCHCKSDIPEADQFLAQKIVLTFDEDEFLRTANRTAA
jgi:hypothetical protein